MSDHDDSPNHDGYDPLEHQASYIFVPASTSEPAQPAPKRRKLAKSRLAAENIDEKENFKFGALFNGAESPECVELRFRLYEESWQKIQGRIQDILHKSNEKVMEDVTGFVSEEVEPEYERHIPTGLITTGPNIASQGLLFEQLAERLSSTIEGPVVLLQSGDAPNLKTTLKKLTRSATNQQEGIDDEEVQAVNKSQSRKLLNYDLQILHDYVVQQRSSNVVIAFQDSEAFDSSLLAELVTLFSSWLDRIPFVLLFGIATSVELFHERLPRAATMLMHGKRFDVEETSATFTKVFKFAVADPEATLKLGPSLMGILIERQHDHLQSVQAFVASLKYAYMCHYYANPLSIFLAENATLDTIQVALQPEHFEAVRMLPSFRERVETLLYENRLQEARLLLEDDEILFQEIKRSLADRKTELLALMQKLHILTSICPQKGINDMDLYIQAYSGNVVKKDFVQDFLVSLKDLSSQEVIRILDVWKQAIILGDSEGYLAPFSGADTILDILLVVTSEIERLQRLAKTSGKPLRTRSTAQQQSVRTMIVGQKVQLTKGRAAVSDDDAAYSKLIDGVAELLSTCFQSKDPHDLFLHEVWLYDLKSPSRDVFSPRPRFATERALSAPHDYLGCTCCQMSQEGLSATQPATAIVYQLYLEAGSMINIFDLWSAFFTIVSGEDSDDSDERGALVLFYRALADLRLMGMIKNSRKKTDHLLKLAWKGL